jgi:hypothetical protein
MEFLVQKARLGIGFDVVYEGRRLWFKQAISPLQAILAGINEISTKGGPPPAALVAAISDKDLKKSVLEYVADMMKSADEPAVKPITRKEALEYLEKSIKSAETEKERYEKNAFYTRIVMMKTEQELQEHPGYPRLAAEVKGNNEK